jgi:hypothetical protein
MIPEAPPSEREWVVCEPMVIAHSGSPPVSSVPRAGQGSARGPRPRRVGIWPVATPSFVRPLLTFTG